MFNQFFILPECSMSICKVTAWQGLCYAGRNLGSRCSEHFSVFVSSMCHGILTDKITRDLCVLNRLQEILTAKVHDIVRQNKKCQPKLLGTIYWIKERMIRWSPKPKVVFSYPLRRQAGLERKDSPGRFGTTSAPAPSQQGWAGLTTEALENSPLCSQNAGEVLLLSCSRTLVAGGLEVTPISVSFTM